MEIQIVKLISHKTSEQYLKKNRPGLTFAYYHFYQWGNLMEN